MYSCTMSHILVILELNFYPLQMLGASLLVDRKWNRSYVLSTQGSVIGGFSKWPDSHPGRL